MKKFKLTILGTGALALMLGLNIRHAVNNYGIMDGKLHTEILAQSNSSGGGSGSGGSGSGNGSGSGSGGSGSGGYELPEVVITCGQYTGQCWKVDEFPRYPWSDFTCFFTGAMIDLCFN